MTIATVQQRAIDWIASGDTGLSSETIWSVMMGAQQVRGYRRGAYPLDPDDFGRCYRLLSRIPEWRPRLPEVADRYPFVWCGLVESWDELTALYEEEVGTGHQRYAHFGKRAPRLYTRMREIEDAARQAAKEAS